jgi:hypothetical protein
MDLGLLRNWGTDATRLADRRGRDCDRGFRCGILLAAACGRTAVAGSHENSWVASSQTFNVRSPETLNRLDYVYGRRLYKARLRHPRNHRHEDSNTVWRPSGRSEGTRNLTSADAVVHLHNSLDPLGDVRERSFRLPPRLDCCPTVVKH